ncbi:MAG: hypothetical protein ACRED9_01845 [Caulobacteraceae bacterium]
MKIFSLRTAAIAAWAIGLGSWLPMALIENNALHNPDRPSGELTAPLRIKGTVRYVTPDEASIDGAANIGFWTGLLAFGAVIVLLRIKDRPDR